MTLSDFNSKINLPLYVKNELKLNRIQFKKIPARGWFAASTDQAVVGNIFELVDPAEVRGLYKKMTLERREFLETPLVYNTATDEALYRNYLSYISNLLFYQAAVENTGAKIRGTGGQTIHAYCKAYGMTGLLVNNLGLLDVDFLKRKGKDDLLKQAPGLLLPTWHAPGHLSTLEVARLDNVDDRKMIWSNGEKGWYGVLNDKLLNSVADLKYTKGFTWSREADFWTQDVVELPANLEIHNIARIWKEAKLTKFNVPLIEHLISYYDEDQVTEQLSLFSRDQIKEIEKKTGWTLEKRWLADKSGSCMLGDNEYIRRDNKYFFNSNGTEREITNFAVDINSIHSGHPTQWNGILCHEDRAYPFELPGARFSSLPRFVDSIHELFIEAHFGMPHIHPTHKKYLLEIIKKMNIGVEII